MELGFAIIHIIEPSRVDTVIRKLPEGPYSATHCFPGNGQIKRKVPVNTKLHTGEVGEINKYVIVCGGEIDR